MANYIAVTLFDHPDHANAGMRALENKGFDNSNISYIESDPESQNFFKRVFNRDGGEELEAEKAQDYLTGLGIDDDEAENYAKKVKKGHSLVIARCDSKSEAERARRILDEEPFGEEGPGPKTERRGAATEAGRPKQPGYDSPAKGVDTEGETTGRTTPRAQSEDIGAGTGDIGAETEEFGAESEDIRTESDRGDISLENVSPDTTTGYDEYETDYRQHYDEYLTDSDLEYSNYTRGYRYGMALAEDETLHEYEWETIEPEAGRQWETREDTSWDDVKEAVRYAWYKVRGREEDYERRPSRNL